MDFHSPAYELAWLLAFVNNIIWSDSVNCDDDAFVLPLLAQICRLKTFNSPLHLPWWWENISVLWHKLFGMIKNDQGDATIRYGMTYLGKSVEIVEYALSTGWYVYHIKSYNDENFGTACSERVIKMGDNTYTRINENWFFKFALSEIS